METFGLPGYHGGHGGYGEEVGCTNVIEPSRCLDVLICII